VAIFNTDIQEDELRNQTTTVVWVCRSTNSQQKIHEEKTKTNREVPPEGLKLKAGSFTIDKRGGLDRVHPCKLIQLRNSQISKFWGTQMDAWKSLKDPGD